MFTCPQTELHPQCWCFQTSRPTASIHCQKVRKTGYLPSCFMRMSQLQPQLRCFKTAQPTASIHYQIHVRKTRYLPSRWLRISVLQPQPRCFKTAQPTVSIHWQIPERRTGDSPSRWMRMSKLQPQPRCSKTAQPTVSIHCQIPERRAGDLPSRWMRTSALFMCSRLCSLKMVPSRSNDEGGGAILEAGIGLKSTIRTITMHSFMCSLIHYLHEHFPGKTLWDDGSYLKNL